MSAVARILGLILLIGAAAGASATTVFVTDEFEITLRSGESTQHSIVRMLASGTPLEQVAPDSGSGYTQVRTPGGTDGFVLTRFLMAEPAARAQLAELRARLARADNEQGGLSTQVDELLAANATAERDIASLRTERDGLATELDRIRTISADAIRIEQDNRSLATQVNTLEATIATLTTENELLLRASSRNWFLAGGGLVVFSMLFGIGLTRIRWRKRSSWSDF